MNQRSRFLEQMRNQLEDMDKEHTEKEAKKEEEEERESIKED
jgi:hypothetical protein